MSNSIHVARWINQIADQGWDIHLFPSIDNGKVHSDIKNVTVYHSVYYKPPETAPSVRLKGVRLFQPLLLGAARPLAFLARQALQRRWPRYRITQLQRVIQRIKPDVVHAMEFQQAGYLTVEAQKELEGDFPPWIATNYGSDIYLYGRLAAHRDKVKEVLANCDYYTCECERDVRLAKEMGLRGEVLAVLPCSSGFDLNYVAQLRQDGPTSARRLIVLKGYQHWAGRALCALRALELCAADLPALSEYRVAIYSATPDVEIAAELAAQSTGLQIDIIPRTSHENILRLFGSARVYLGLSISDATSTSLLDALAMGVFPIQSCTSCVDEWVIDGETGFIVPPEDPHIVAQALRRALTDDALVDRATEQNYKVSAERLDEDVIRPQIVNIYEKIATDRRIR